jgi:hypothetical protein
MRRLATRRAWIAEVAPRMAFLRRYRKNIPSGASNQLERPDVAVS